MESQQKTEEMKETANTAEKGGRQHEQKISGGRKEERMKKE